MFLIFIHGNACLDSWVGKIPWRRVPTPVFLGFPGGSDGKESASNVGDLGSITGLGRSPGGGHGQPTPVFLPGESHRQRSLMGYSPWGCKEWDKAECLSTTSNAHLGTYSQSDGFSSSHVQM